MGKLADTACMLALAGAIASAQAQQIYMCKDASGRTLTSDRPIPECADRSTRLMSKDGVVRKEIAPPPTAEQRAAIREAEERKKQEELARAEQKKRDMLLLSTYRSEKDIEAARERVIAQMRADIIDANNSAAAAVKKKAKAEAEIATIRNRNKNAKIPAELQTRYDEANAAETLERKRADKLEADLLLQKEKYDGIMARFRDLNKEETPAKR